MALDFVDEKAHDHTRVRVPAPSEEDVRVSDRVDVTKLDLNKREEFELALVAYFENLFDGRIPELGISVDTSERRWMAARSLAGVMDNLRNVGKTRDDDAKTVRDEQNAARKDEDNEVVEPQVLQSTDPRAN